MPLLLHRALISMQRDSEEGDPLSMIMQKQGRWIEGVCEDGTSNLQSNNMINEGSTVIGLHRKYSPGLMYIGRIAASG